MGQAGCSRVCNNCGGGTGGTGSRNTSVDALTVLEGATPGTRPKETIKGSG